MRVSELFLPLVCVACAPKTFHSVVGVWKSEPAIAGMTRQEQLSWLQRASGFDSEHATMAVASDPNAPIGLLDEWLASPFVQDDLRAARIREMMFILQEAASWPGVREGWSLEDRLFVEHPLIIIKALRSRPDIAQDIGMRPLIMDYSRQVMLGEVRSPRYGITMVYENPAIRSLGCMVEYYLGASDEDVSICLGEMKR